MRTETLLYILGLATASLSGIDAQLSSEGIYTIQTSPPNPPVGFSTSPPGAGAASESDSGFFTIQTDTRLRTTTTDSSTASPGQETTSVDPAVSGTSISTPNTSFLSTTTFNPNSSPSPSSLPSSPPRSSAALISNPSAVSGGSSGGATGTMSGLPNATSTSAAKPAYGQQCKVGMITGIGVLVAKWVL